MTEWLKAPLGDRRVQVLFPRLSTFRMIATKSGVSPCSFTKHNWCPWDSTQDKWHKILWRYDWLGWDNVWHWFNINATQSQSGEHIVAKRLYTILQKPMFHKMFLVIQNLELVREAGAARAYRDELDIVKDKVRFISGEIITCCKKLIFRSYQE